MDPKEPTGLLHERRETNHKEWKKRVQYGKRWQGGTIISSFKRLCWNSVRAVTMDNVVREVGLKVDIYNLVLEIQKRAIAAV